MALDDDLAALARRLEHDFAAPDLLREALSHPSATASRAARPGARGASYQRLEFLGDRVLGLIVAELLFRRFPRETEGDLARRLAALVRQDSLAQVAEALDLGAHLRLARAEEEAGGRLNPALLADACEAVIGALYLDGGLEAARAVIVPHWMPLLEAETSPPQDAKTALQEWAQGRGLPLPRYREVARAGPDHEPQFTVEVAVEGQPVAQGEGRSKRLAEQVAATALLARLTGAAP